MTASITDERRSINFFSVFCDLLGEEHEDEDEDEDDDDDDHLRLDPMRAANGELSSGDNLEVRDQNGFVLGRRVAMAENRGGEISPIVGIWQRLWPQGAAGTLPRCLKPCHVSFKMNTCVHE